MTLDTVTVDIDHLRTWIGRTEAIEDTVTKLPVAAMSATLDRDDPPPLPGDPLPPLWHWLYFLPLHRQSELGPDGHAKRGGFLPPVPLPRRMWAGGRFEFHRPLRVGEAIRRNSTIAEVSQRHGHTGPLVFVLVRHEIAGEDGLALIEEHDIVYREAPAPNEAAPVPRPAPAQAAWRRDIVPDDVLLFRYSALTFNGHRIHYDRRYVTEVEGYPGLIVHGPLIATLLADLLRRNVAAAMTRFSFRAVRPLFDIAPFAVCGVPEGEAAKVWAQDAEGFLAMQADAEFGTPENHR
ncbi:MAG TPA: MaoC family dehydratase N-terminal domain-containing protein [Xanthobacteraceae bacterium]|jgi:3-methylfumaryl-CoA hydratase